ncbi:hypothetical protein ACFY05_42920 [Microtetraspora fusca]|uniref:Restriction endonuclease type IV Mrr domain-containing protein n=1 Tax=Microtetraspora fusca TaxID=1997 RepID=A0ABW6VMW0_MICFU
MLQDRSEEATDQSAPLIKMSRFIRTITFLLALTLMAVGGVAVFLTENGTGASVFAITGGVFALLALIGLIPSRLKFGDTEVELIHILQKSLELLPQEAREELISEVSSQSQGTARQVVVSAVGAWYIYESSASSAIRRTAPQSAEVLIEAGGMDKGWDALVTAPQRTGAIGIEIKHRRPERKLDQATIHAIAGRLQAIKNTPKPSKMLIVSNVPPTKSAQVALRDSKDIFFVQWRDEMDDEALKRELSESLRSLPVRGEADE